MPSSNSGRSMLKLAAIIGATGIAMLGLPAATSATPQQGQPVASQDDPAPFPYLGVVTANEVHIRCNASTSYYPFGRLKEGDLVVIMGEKYNWAKVAVAGPSFESLNDWYGYIKVPKGETGKFTVNSTGTVGKTFDRVNIDAPNLLKDRSIEGSWRAIHRLPAGIEVKILETLETEEDTVYRVVLPETAAGWINMQYIERANPTQLARWEAWRTGERVASKPGEKPSGAGQDEGQGVLASDPASQPPAVTKPADAGAQNNTDSNDAAGTTTDEAPVTPEPADVNDAAGNADELADHVAGGARDAEAKPGTTTPPTKKAANEIVTGADNADATMPEQPKVKSPRDRLADLESAYALMSKQDMESREAGPLRQLYVDLSEIDTSDAKPETKRVVAYARARARQLSIMMDLQKRRQELRVIRERLSLAQDEAGAARLSIQAGGSYAAVGKLSVSTVYDGNRLPRLLRVQDPGTGRTIAYLRSTEQMDYAGMLGQLIGVVGQRSFDESTGLSLIKPSRIDILAAQ